MTLRQSVSALIVLVLIGCRTEAPDPGPLSFTPVDVSTPQPEATTAVSSADYQSQEFPYPYVLTVIGEENGGQAYLQRGVGRVVFNDDLTVATVTIEEGAEPISLFRPEPSGNFFDSETATLDSFEILAGLFLPRSEAAGLFFASGNGFDVEGIVGFETPEQPDPVDLTLVYENESFVFPELTLVVEGDEFSRSFTPDSDAMALSVDFATGDVTGQLFSGFGSFDYDGDFSQNDEVTIVASLENGRLEDAELRGEVSFNATIDRDRSGEISDLPFTVTSVNVRGHLYGDQAQALGVVYSGEGTVLGPEGDQVPIVFGGVSLGQP